MGLTPGPVEGGQMSGYLTPGMVAGECVCRHVGLGPDLGPDLGLGLGLGLGSECRVNPLTSPRQSVAAACAVSPDLCAHTYDPFYLRAL